MLKNTRRWKKIFLIPITVLAFSLTPFLRSCGDVSYGYPLVTIEATSSFKPAGFRPLVFLINLAVISVIACMLLALTKRRSIILSGGIRGMGIYNIMVWAGYMVIYPLMPLNDVMGYIAGIYLYFLYPPFTLMDNLQGIIPQRWATSWMFGDGDDIPLRIIYTCMVLLWFILGCFTSWHRRKTGTNTAGEDNPS